MAFLGRLKFEMELVISVLRQSKLDDVIKAFVVETILNNPKNQLPIFSEIFCRNRLFSPTAKYRSITNSI